MWGTGIRPRPKRILQIIHFMTRRIQAVEPEGAFILLPLICGTNQDILRFLGAPVDQETLATKTIGALLLTTPRFAMTVQH